MAARAIHAFATMSRPVVAAVLVSLALSFIAVSRPAVAGEQNEDEGAVNGDLLFEEREIEDEASDDPMVSDEVGKLFDLAVKRKKNSHRFGATYAKNPLKKWNSDLYGAYASNTFMLGEDWRLGVNLNYSQLNTFGDKNFPDRLYAASGRISFGGRGFTASAGFANKGDALFDSMDRINFNAMAGYQVWRQGPHSIGVGALYSSKGEFWRLALPLPLFWYRYIASKFMINLGLPMIIVIRPTKDFLIMFTGMLPGVGAAGFIYRITPNFSMGAQYSHEKQSYYLRTYPYRDWRYCENSLREAFHVNGGKRFVDKKFVLEQHVVGARIGIDAGEVFSLKIFAGYRFGTTYYFTKNILAAEGRSRKSNSFIARCSADFRFTSGGGGDPTAQ